MYRYAAHGSQSKQSARLLTHNPFGSRGVRTIWHNPSPAKGQGSLYASQTDAQVSAQQVLAAADWIWTQSLVSLTNRRAHSITEQFVRAFERRQQGGGIDQSGTSGTENAGHI